MSVKSQIAHANHQVLSLVRRLPYHVRALLRPQLAENVAQPILQVTVRERQADLATFYTRYEDLVELICDASQYGPNPALEEKYDELRSWMLRTYPLLRPYILGFIDHQVVDTEQNLELYGQATDAFQALFSPPTLRTLIQSDDGHMIGRIVRTRDALNRYGEHLRTLAA